MQSGTATLKERTDPMIAETLATQTNNTGLTLRDKLLLVRHQVERALARSIHHDIGL